METMNIDTGDQIARRLNAIALGSPNLAVAARLLSAILPVLREEEVSDPATELSADDVRARLEEQGIPLLEDHDLEVDVEQAASLLVRLAAAAEKAGAPRVSAEKISLWLDEEHYGDEAAAFQTILGGDDHLLERTAKDRGLDGRICRFLAQNAMKPLLRAWGRKLSALAANVHWDKGVCFVCGSVPLLAELQGNNQERHLRCGLCGSDWRVKRLSCPHCGNDDHRSLKVIFQNNDPAKPRIEACDRCLSYLKVIPAFSPTTADLLAVEDLATLDLDAVALKKGYRRPAAE